MCYYLNSLHPPNLQFAHTPIVVSVVAYTFHGHISLKKLHRVWFDFNSSSSRASLGRIFGSCYRRLQLSRHPTRYFTAPLIVFSLANVVFESVYYLCFRPFSQCILLASYLIVVIVAPSLKLPVFVGTRNSFQHLLCDILI